MNRHYAIDTANSPKFQLRGIKAEITYYEDGGVPSVELRIGKLGWIRFHNLYEADAVRRKLNAACDQAWKTWEEEQSCAE